jgi:xanthine/uracil permease
VLAALTSRLSFGQFLIAVLLAAGVSTWVYWHASKHGSRHPTAWGVATFLFVGLVLPLYLITYYVTRRRF